MNKLTLNLDELQVETFEVVDDPQKARGTVRANCACGYCCMCPCCCTAQCTYYGDATCAPNATCVNTQCGQYTCNESECYGTCYPEYTCYGLRCNDTSPRLCPIDPYQ
ncbi:MAG TPA: hypothetical protein VFQ45_06905 [Longimicrobium sp.]|nr:hypothetical protein [Longimicrobium sp.]